MHNYYLTGQNRRKEIRPPHGGGAVTNSYAIKFCANRNEASNLGVSYVSCK